MPHRTLTLEEAADFLHVTVHDLLSLIQNEDVPYEKQGRRLLFRRVHLEAWASQHVMSLREDHLHAYHAKASRAGSAEKESGLISRLMRSEYIQPNLPARTRKSVIREMCDLANNTGRVHSPVDLYRALEAREELGTTGLSGGVALLHPQRHDPYLFDGSFVVLGRSLSPVPFGAPDGRTTDLFFLLCIGDDGLHLKTLSRLCVMCNQTSALMELRQAETAQEMLDMLNRCEVKVVKKT